MPRNRRLMDYMMRRDGRNPYGSAGGYVSSRRVRRDRGMVEHYPTHRDYAYEQEMEDGRRMRNAKGQYISDRAYEMPHERDYGSFHEERGFKPVEAMGYFTGYAGGDYRGRDMGYDPYYNYPMMDYRDMRYDMAGDYGESLTHEELEKWCKKMMSRLDEREKQMFSKESILQRAKNMGIQFDKFSEMEFYVNTVKNYTDHKKSIGENPEMAVKLARDDFNDEDGEFKGSEWLAVYFDTFVKQDD